MKENIDGEALDWARKRLLADGDLIEYDPDDDFRRAPVDNSHTLGEPPKVP